MGELLDDFVTDHAANRRTSSGAGQPTAQHITHHTTHDGTGRRALFLMGHTGATPQTQRRDQQHGRQTGVKTSVKFHGKFLHIKSKNQIVLRMTAVTGESPLLVSGWGVSVRPRTQWTGIFLPAGWFVNVKKLAIKNIATEAINTWA
jgi:hypothetical protein